MGQVSKSKRADLTAFSGPVNASAARVRGLWLSHIALLTYLVVTVGAVSHRDLFLENPVRLPVLNVDLPLTGFFLVAPLFLLVNHFYLLLNLQGIAARIREFDAAVEEAQNDESLTEAAERRERRALDSFIIVQMLGGTKEERSGWTGFFFVGITWITVAIAPIGILLQMQLIFLPYHLEWLSWVHRLALTCNLALLAVFWPSIIRRHESLDATGRSTRLQMAVAASVMVFSWFIGTFPGERLDKADIGGNILELDHWQTPEGVNHWLFKRFLVRSLDLSGQILIDPDDLNKIDARKPEGEEPWSGERTLRLSRPQRTRDFVGADLSDTDLRRADLRSARLQGATLASALLQGASLENAQLQGASLFGTRLQGASLVNAQLHGVPLNDAQLQGAMLRFAELRGASFDSAQLQGATLDYAELQGASFVGAELQGASLAGAQLQGVLFRGAQLQGASLAGADLESASLAETFLWRAYGDPHLVNSLISGTVIKRRWLSLSGQIAEFTIEEYLHLKGRVVLDVTDKAARKHILARVQRLDPTVREPDEFLKLSARDPRFEGSMYFSYFRHLKNLLEKLACDAEAAPYVAEGLSLHGPILQTGPYAGALAQILLDASGSSRKAAEKCPGAAEISEEAKEALRRIKQ